MKYSVNKRAAKAMGLRPTDAVVLDHPVELGYHCPVCKYPDRVNGDYDTRLMWSEYNGFVWCRVCNKDYPSALCVPNVDKAIDVFLATVEDAVRRAGKAGE